jgi:hypothetical protein
MLYQAVCTDQSTQYNSQSFKGIIKPEAEGYPQNLALLPHLDSERQATNVEEFMTNFQTMMDHKKEEEDLQRKQEQEQRVSNEVEQKPEKGMARITQFVKNRINSFKSLKDIDNMQVVEEEERDSYLDNLADLHSSKAPVSFPLFDDLTEDAAQRKERKEVQDVFRRPYSVFEDYNKGDDDADEVKKN